MIRFHMKWMKTCLFANLRSFSFYLLTTILILGFGLTDSVVKEVDEDTQVLVYVDNSQVGEYVCGYLQTDSPDGFTFIQVNSLDELKSSVCKGDVSCGVVFTADSDDYAKQNGVVDIYQTSGTADGYIVQEIIYPIMYRSRGEERLKQYLADLEWEDKSSEDYATQYILNWYTDYLQNSGVHIYDVAVTGTGTENQQTSDKTIARVIIYMLIVLIAAGICIYDVAGSDKGFYQVFVKKQRLFLYVEKVIMTIVMSTTIAMVLKIVIFS